MILATRIVQPAMSLTVLGFVWGCSNAGSNSAGSGGTNGRNGGASGQSASRPYASGGTTAALVSSVAEVGHRLISMVRKCAPNAKVGLFACGWGTTATHTILPIMRELGLGIT